MQLLRSWLLPLGMRSGVVIFFLGTPGMNS